MKQLKIGFDFDGVIVFWLFFLKKDVKKVLKLLQSQGHEIKIVTARGAFLSFLAKLTLKIYGLGDLSIVGVGKNGHKYGQLKGFDIFIDNKVKHLIAIDGRVGQLYLFTKKPVDGFKNIPNWWKAYCEIQWLSHQG